LGIRVNIGVTGEKTYAILSKTITKLLILLIGEGFDWGCVETLLTPRESNECRELSNNCFTCTSWRCD